MFVAEVFKHRPLTISSDTRRAGVDPAHCEPDDEVLKVGR